ncbi:MAG: DUF169 domain-containing protein [Bacteroidales bacterium]|jgi:uncharacterized protein (DUF169 family)
MNTQLKSDFIKLWKKYFSDAELPIVFFYTEGDGGAEPAIKSKGHSCLICELSKVRNGKSLWFNKGSLGCPGSIRYLGYTEKMRPGFEYFLSCGNASMQGERYIRTPEMVKELMKNQKMLPVSGRNIVFKRWDNIAESDEPLAVIFFATPDVLSGLFTLANFDQTEPNGTYTPFGAGCSSVVHYPFLESMAQRPRAVIGMFDPSARPCVLENVLTFSVPMKKLEKMISYMEESFLITDTWQTVKKRILK